MEKLQLNTGQQAIYSIIIIWLRLAHMEEGDTLDGPDW